MQTARLRLLLFAVFCAGSLLAAWSPARAQDAATLSTLYSFVRGVYSQPLVLGTDGNFYGTIAGDYPVGTAAFGSVYRLTPGGVFTVLHAFSGSVDGEVPAPLLLRGSDGNFYGLTYQGGANNKGTFYQVTPAGVFTVIADLPDAPLSGNYSLTQGTDGNFYGTADDDGANFEGTVFQITPAGVYSTLHTFNLNDAGGYAPTDLTAGSDGNLYGTTFGGGASGHGTVFRISPTGEFTVLHSFGNAGDGSAPLHLFQAGDGNFYGVTSGSSGAQDSPALLRLTPAGELTTLYRFTVGEYGGASIQLIEGADGNFYGTSTLDVDGATTSTFFRLTAAGVFTPLYAFDGSGNTDVSSLIQGADGSFYVAGEVGSGYDYVGKIFDLTPRPAFFAGATGVGDGVYFLAFPTGTYFGFFSFLDDPGYVYHFDLGYEYVFDANDGQAGVYLYDFASNTFFYTSPTFPFPYLYSFSLNSVVYYYPDPVQPGRYNTNGIRYFYVFSTGEIVAE